MSPADTVAAMEEFTRVSTKAIHSLVRAAALGSQDKENLKKKLQPAYDMMKEATEALRVSEALTNTKPSPFLSVVQKTTAATGSRIDQLGIPDDCYFALQGVDITKGLRDVSRGRNPIFSRVIHLVRDILLVSPAASGAFMSFLDKCETISTEQPSFETCPLRLTNRFHGFRLYALITRDPEVYDSSEYLDVGSLRKEILASKFSARSRYSKEFRLLFPLFLSLEGYPNVLTPGAWEVFFRFPGTVEDDKELEARATAETLSDASKEVLKRVKAAGLFPYLPDAIRTGSAIRDPLQAMEALKQSSDIQTATESRNLAQAIGSFVLSAHQKFTQGGGRPASRTLPEPESKRKRGEGPGNLEHTGRKGPYVTRVNGKDVPIPAHGARVQKVRMQKICRFCGHTDHSYKISGATTECPVNGNSEHYNPDEPWEFGYLVAIQERSAK